MVQTRPDNCNTTFISRYESWLLANISISPICQISLFQSKYFDTGGDGQHKIWEQSGGETGWHEGFVNIGYGYNHKVAFEVGIFI